MDDTIVLYCAMNSTTTTGFYLWRGGASYVGEMYWSHPAEEEPVQTSRLADQTQPNPEYIKCRFMATNGSYAKLCDRMETDKKIQLWRVHFFCFV